MLSKRNQPVLLCNDIRFPTFCRDLGGDSSKRNYNNPPGYGLDASCTTVAAGSCASPPHVIVGFNLPSEKSGLMDANKSPRSVLESPALDIPVRQDHKQKSALQFLLLSPCRKNESSCVGLVGLTMKAEEEEYPCSNCPACPQVLAVEHPPSRSQPISIGQTNPVLCEVTEPAGEARMSATLSDTHYLAGRGFALLDGKDGDDQGHHEAPFTTIIPPLTAVDSLLLSKRMLIEARPSIFSTESPVSSFCYEHAYLRSDFLEACFLCDRALSYNKDVYMYRGDCAFCSPECRYEQILIDERRERGSKIGSCQTGRYQRSVGTTAAFRAAA